MKSGASGAMAAVSRPDCTRAIWHQWRRCIKRPDHALYWNEGHRSPSWLNLAQTHTGFILVSFWFNDCVWCVRRVRPHTFCHIRAGRPSEPRSKRVSPVAQRRGAAGGGRSIREAVSIFSDFIAPMVSIPGMSLFEHGGKFFGIVNWTAYFVLATAQHIRSGSMAVELRTSDREAGAWIPAATFARTHTP